MKARGIDWQEFKQELLTEEERREIEDKASLMCALIAARKNRGMTQQKHAEKLSKIFLGKQRSIFYRRFI